MASRYLSLSLFALSALASADFSVEYVSGTNNLNINAEIPAADVAIPIIASVPRSSFKKHMMHSLRTHASGYDGSVTTLAGSSMDEEYLVNVTVGGQHFPVIVDTGSSDLWLVEKGFKCFNLTSYPEKPETCGFGSKGFNPKASSTFQKYEDRNFNISYGDGEFLTGSVGFETVKVGGLQVTKQEFGVVDKAAWNGDGVNSGLLGLAGPTLTSVFKGTNPDNDNSKTNWESYNPFFYTAVAEKKVKNPYFSIALNRGAAHLTGSKQNYDPHLGYIALGGYAPVATVKPSVTVPWIGIKTQSRGSGYFYYTIQIDKYTFPGSSKIATFSNSTILDSGTTLNYVPTKVAEKYNAAFQPPAKLSDDFGGYVVECSAKVPEFKVTIGGKEFSIDGRDQLLDLGVKNSKGKELCLTGTQDGGAATGGNIFILGDVFLHNVVATFNIKAHQVHLAQRKSY